MNKTFLVIFAVAVCVIDAVPVPSADDPPGSFDEYVNLISTTTRSTCFSAAVEKARSSNPDLNDFFQAAEKAHKKYLEKVKSCDHISDIEEREWVAVISVGNSQFTDTITPSSRLYSYCSNQPYVQAYLDYNDLVFKLNRVSTDATIMCFAMLLKCALFPFHLRYRTADKWFSKWPEKSEKSVGNYESIGPSPWTFRAETVF